MGSLRSLLRALLDERSPASRARPLILLLERPTWGLVRARNALQGQTPWLDVEQKVVPPEPAPEPLQAPRQSATKTSCGTTHTASCRGRNAREMPCEIPRERASTSESLQNLPASTAPDEPNLPMAAPTRAWAKGPPASRRRAAGERGWAGGPKPPVCVRMGVASQSGRERCCLPMEQAGCQGRHLDGEGSAPRLCLSARVAARERRLLDSPMPRVRPAIGPPLARRTLRTRRAAGTRRGRE